MTILKIIDQYDFLKKGLKFILQTNPSNYAPYHNLNHMLTVVRHAYYALVYEELLGEDMAEELLMTALFHDYNHSMGENIDEVNVSKAKNALRTFVEEHKK